MQQILKRLILFFSRDASEGISMGAADKTTLYAAIPLRGLRYVQSRTINK